MKMILFFLRDEPFANTSAIVTESGAVLPDFTSFR